MEIPKGTVILQAVVGSTAYGLANADSDEDRLGCFVAPSVEFFGLHPPVDKRATVVQTDPDHTMHEVGKLVKLLLVANPTVTELLWLDEYEVCTLDGQLLIEMRTDFLSGRAVRNAYFGYATQQFERLKKRGGTFSSDTRKRTAKHARHLLRLLHHGYELYSTGHLTVRLADPEKYMAFGMAVEADHGAAGDVLALYESMFDSATPALAEEHNSEAAESFLRDLRLRELCGKLS